ncbi:MAG: Crp/Fnr family transcriptional regulator [Chloroflexi bacterium]|nr:Crp/Fnr family transcriptional regulator [Chloroflexota bacterium]
MVSLVSPAGSACPSCFGGLKPTQVDWLQGSFKERTYARGEIVFFEGDPCPGLFIVKSGSVKLYRTSSDGNEQIVRMIGDGGCFECAPLFDGGPNPVSAEALEDSRLYFLPAEAFRALVKEHPETMMAMAAVLAMRLRALISMVEDFSFKSIYSRLANLLLRLGERREGLMVVSPTRPLNQQHLACMLGCSRQMVNISLRKLVKAGLVRMDGRQIAVLNPDALQDIARTRN